MRNRIFQEVLDETPEDVKIFVRLYSDLVHRVHTLMEEKGISKKELATRMEKSPSEISKWLNGEHNFTLRSIARLSAELGEPLLVVSQRPHHTAFLENDVVIRYKHVHKSIRPVGQYTQESWRSIAEEEYANELNHAG